VVYTRYADDLAFSGGHIPVSFIDIVTKIVEDYGLNVNKDKTKLLRKAGQRIVTGISVSGSSLTLPRKTKRKLRKDIHFIKNYGLLSHISKERINQPNYLASLEGKFQFWNQIEPNNEFVLSSILTLKNISES